MYALSHIFLNSIFNVFYNFNTFQVVIGRPDKQEVHTCTSNQIEEGTMVAVYLTKYAGGYWSARTNKKYIHVPAIK